MPSALLSKLFASDRARRNLRRIVFVYLGLVLCPIYYWPQEPIIDGTWHFAMNYGAAHHLLLGRDILWTSGPLTYLAVPQDIGSNLTQAVLFQTGLWIVLLVVLWQLVFRSGFRLRNLALFSVFIALSGAIYPVPLGLADILLVIALVLLVQFQLYEKRIPFVVALVLLGLIPFIKFVGAVIVAGVLAGLIVDRLLQRDRGAAWQVVLAVLIPGSVALAGWWLTQGTFSNLKAYVKSSLELSQGYSSAMSQNGPTTDLLAAFEAALFLVIAVAILWQHNRRMARFLTFLLALPLLMSFKHGFVRQDGHIAHFFCFVAIALGLVALLTPLIAQRVIVKFAIVTLLYAAIWQGTVARTNPRLALWGTGIGAPIRVANALWLPHLRRTLAAQTQKNFPPSLRLEPEIKAVIGDQPVASLSNSYNEAFIEGLNLVLYPVPQRYSAYTTHLDQLNADWIQSQGPRFLIFDGLAIDGRHPWLDTTAMWLEVYRWYQTRMLGQHTLLLERRSAPRFTRLESLGQSEMHFGQPLPMPAHDLLFWSMKCSLNSKGRLQALLFRIADVNVTLGQPLPETTFRVVPAVFVAPSLGDELPTDLKDFAEVFSPHAVPKDRVDSMTFAGPGISSYNPTCDVQWLRAVP